MKAYLIQIGSFPTKIAIDESRAIGFVETLVDQKVRDTQRKLLAEDRGDWDVFVHRCNGEKGTIRQRYKATVAYRHGTKVKHCGQTRVMEYRIWEVEFVDSALEMIARQAE